MKINNFKILFSESKFWKQKKILNFKIYYRSEKSNILNIPINKTSNLNSSKIINYLINLPGLNTFIIKKKNEILCVSDRISSSSIFYNFEKNKLIISNNSQLILNYNSKKLKINSQSANEAMSAGYVLNNKTIFENIFRLESAKYLYFNKKKKKFSIKQYFNFYPKKKSNKTTSELIDELDEINKKVFIDLIKKADGKKILIPLSGGLDSRHVLTFLLRLKYKNIETFSYGVPGNYDALVAKKIANHLDVKWSFYPTTYKQFKNIYYSNQRKLYWNFADELIMVPNLFSYDAISRIKKNPKQTIIVNGNAGDFLTGNHIPILKEKKLNSDILLNYIIKKHFSHNKKILSEIFLKNIKKNILNKEFLKHNEFLAYEKFAKHFENWEFFERQSKRVVNAQKVYEFFNYEWELPLWDYRLVNFWKNQKLKHKLSRSLFIKYLQAKDDFNVFNDDQIKELSVWTKNSRYITYIGKILRLLAGNIAADNFYKFCKIFSKNGFMYSSINFNFYLKNYKNYNDPLSYWSEDWVKNKINSIFKQ